LIISLFGGSLNKNYDVACIINSITLLLPSLLKEKHRNSKQKGGSLKISAKKFGDKKNIITFAARFEKSNVL
jgi:hypothetical protein